MRSRFVRRDRGPQVEALEGRVSLSAVVGEGPGDLTPRQGHVMGYDSARSPGDPEASVPSVSEIVVTKEQDDSSANLLGQALLSLELENTLISSYNISGHGGSSNDRPMESLSLN